MKNTEMVLRRLGYPDGTSADPTVLRQIDDAWTEISEIANFQYVYAEFTHRLDFLNHPSYAEYLQSTDHYLLCATTLGIAVDRRLSRHQVQNMSYAVVFNACADIFLEEAADEFEAQLPFPEKCFRFCPGYGQTSLSDNRLIAEAVKAKKIGITFLNSGLMIPCKSMTGVIRLSGNASKSCDGCIAGGDCAFRRRGTTCYSTKS